VLTRPAGSGDKKRPRPDQIVPVRTAGKSAREPTRLGGRMRAALPSVSRYSSTIVSDADEQIKNQGQKSDIFSPRFLLRSFSSETGIRVLLAHFSKFAQLFTSSGSERSLQDSKFPDFLTPQMGIVS
jgi:hypothetical protein